MNKTLQYINTQSQGGLKVFSYEYFVADTNEKKELAETLEQLLQQGYIECNISSKPAASGFIVYVITEVCITEKGKEFLANSPS